MIHADVKPAAGRHLGIDGEGKLSAFRCLEVDVHRAVEGGLWPHPKAKDALVLGHGIQIGDVGSYVQ